MYERIVCLTEEPTEILYRLGDPGGRRDGQLHEIKSALILQPGPAALTDGAAALHRIIGDWAQDPPHRG